MLVIVHSGQTGVERGAHRAALTCRLAVAGFMPIDQRDELGPIPVAISDHLTPCYERGARGAAKANVAIASGVLLLVPDARQAKTFPAMGALIRAAKAARLPLLAVDGSTSWAVVSEWAATLVETSGSIRLLVTGPRATRWREGDVLGARAVSAVAMNA